MNGGGIQAGASLINARLIGQMFVTEGYKDSSITPATCVR
jgi:hypothetical protein